MNQKWVEFSNNNKMTIVNMDRLAVSSKLTPKKNVVMLNRDSQTLNPMTNKDIKTSRT
jgi:hypothetical protein